MDKQVAMNEVDLEALIEEHTGSTRVCRNKMNFFLFYSAISALASGSSLYVGVVWLGLIWCAVAGALLGCGVHRFLSYRARAKIRDSLKKELQDLRTMAE